MIFVKCISSVDLELGELGEIRIMKNFFVQCEFLVCDDDVGLGETMLCCLFHYQKAIFVQLLPIIGFKFVSFVSDRTILYRPEA